MLVEAAIGDSYGAGREARPQAEVDANNDGLTYVQHGKWKEMVPGTYTDDTQMATALSEFMLSGKPLSVLNWANAVVETFQNDPRPGYAQGFYKILQEVSNGADLLDRLQPHSRKNGGAMRAFPLGLLRDTSVVIDRAMFQSSLTHATKDGMLAAAASALMTHYFYHDVGPKEALGSWAEGCLGGLPVGWLTKRWKGRVGFVNGRDTVAAAVTAIVYNDSLTDVLKTCVGFGGDTDTVATIAMAAASFCKEIEQDLPQSLSDGLENEEYGLDYLRRLDLRLRRQFTAEGVNALSEPLSLEAQVQKDVEDIEDENLLGLFPA
jgi:ADP-ribosylglycohydrolase